MRMRVKPFTIRLLSLVLMICPATAVGGTTGKIAGTVIDATTREALIGANVIIKDTYLGATTNLDGFYTINNIPPGKHTVIVSYIGYRKYTVTEVSVRIDLTTRVDAQLQSDTIEGEEIVVRADRPLVQKDLTSSSVTVSFEELKRIPTEDLGQVVNIQAGVVGGHFRGGRSNEVAYLVDGVTVTDPFNGQRSLQIENSSISQMEVISGTFNAEYGQAMSGVVNVVTPEGASEYHGSISVYTGDYVTSHTEVFRNTGSLTNLRTRNAQFSVDGPVPMVSGLSFFATGRYFRDEGYLWGKRVYNVTDTSPYILRDFQGAPILDANGNQIYILTHTGDGADVAMNPYRRKSFNGKLSYAFPGWKFAYSLFWDDNWNKYYDHNFAWTPDGIMNHYRTNWVHSLQVTHAPTANTYQTLKLSSNFFDYKGYLYEDAYDPRYVDPNRGTPISGNTFRSGGNQADRYNRHSQALIGQWNLTSQLSTKHKVSVGIEGRLHQIHNHSMSVINKNTVDTDSTGALAFELGYPDLGAPGNQSYTKRPVELSMYLQDKIEYDLMIINAGVRVDYFNPRSRYPLDLRNPTKNPNFPNAGVLKRASRKLQVSPRLGISFPITDQGILHFSYGHFFQIPSFENLYYNSDYLVTQSSGLSNITGNPDLDAQRTIMYELGLQQVLFTNLGLDFTVYYRDIRNLLGMEIINTYEGIKYARFINRDYSKVKGFILSLDRRFADFFGVKLDYTFQIAEGNASDPYSVYYNNQTDPPIETNKKVVPLDWDQRSTLNLSLTLGNPGDWNIGTIVQYGSGFPYTEDIRVSNGLRFENNGTKPGTFTVDLRAEKTFQAIGVNLTVFALVYNLLDRKNENNVNPTSGRANIDLFTYLSGPIIGLNTLEEYLNNPDSFSAPRQVRLGLTAEF